MRKFFEIYFIFKKFSYNYTLFFGFEILARAFEKAFWLEFKG